MVQNTAVVNQIAFMYVVLTLFILFMLAAIVLGIGYREHLKARQIQKENEYMEHQKNLLREYYGSLQSQIDLTRRFRHDLANHIQMLDQLSAHAENQESLHIYALQLQEEYKRLKKIDFCEDMIIDAVLRNAKELCDEKGVEIFFDVRTLQSGDIEGIVLFGVFYKLLDIGIHMIEEPDEKEVRQIRLKSRNIAEHLILQLQIKPCKGKVDEESIRMMESQLHPYEHMIQVLPLDTGDSGVEIYINISQNL